MQDAPQRVVFTSIYSTTSIQEEGTEQIIVVTLASFFLLVVICSCYDLYRTDKRYKKRKEMETDADIFMAKQQSAAILEKTQVIEF